MALRSPELQQILDKIMRFDDQPVPLRNNNPPVWELVKVDMTQRNEFGVEKYGTPLQGFNGRDALQDAYEEALDLCVYLRTAIYERDNPPTIYE